MKVINKFLGLLAKTPLLSKFMDKTVKFELIEVMRIVSEGKMNVGSRPESYPVNDIAFFREWHKGPNDRKIEGEITMVAFQSKRSATVDNGQVNENNSKLMTILIEESYDSFSKRLGAIVPFRRAPEKA